jgi:hypothetical protein
MNRFIKRLSIVAVVGAAVLTTTGPARAQTSAAGTADNGCHLVNLTLACGNSTFGGAFASSSEQVVNSSNQVTATCPELNCDFEGTSLGTAQCATNGGSDIAFQMGAASTACNGQFGIPGSTTCSDPFLTATLTATCADVHPLTKADCMNGGWMRYTNPSFKNQGQCIDYVNHQGG